MARGDIDKLRKKVGTFDEPVAAPIGAVQLPSDGVRYDKRGNPKPLQSGQDEHEERAPREPGLVPPARDEPLELVAHEGFHLTPCIHRRTGGATSHFGNVFKQFGIFLHKRGYRVTGV